MLHLVLDVLLHALVLIDVLLLLHVEEDSGRHSDGNGILWLWLHERRKIMHLTFLALHFSKDELITVVLEGAEL